LLVTSIDKGKHSSDELQFLRVSTEMDKKRGQQTKETNIWNSQFSVYEEKVYAYVTRIPSMLKVNN
jgi:hypothetical protein